MAVYDKLGFDGDFPGEITSPIVEEFPAEEKPFTGSDKFSDASLDIVKLAADFKSGYLNNNPFNYERYLSKKYTDIADIGGTVISRRYEPIKLTSADDFNNLTETRFKTHVNTAKAFIDNIINFTLDIDLSKPKVEYILKFQYCEGHFYKTYRKEIEYGLRSVSTNELFDAIVLKTDNFNDVLSFLELAGYSSGAKFEDYVARRFNAAMDRTDGKALIYLYEKAPLITLRERESQKVWEDFKKLVALDADSFLLDASVPILKTMYHFRSFTYFYNFLIAEPVLIKKAYSVLNGDVFVQNQQFSKKTYFAHQLAYGLAEEGYNATSGKTFYFSDTYYVDSHILSISDSKKESETGRIYLRQLKKYTQEEEEEKSSLGYHPFAAEDSIPDMGGYYDPLEMVYLSVNGDEPVLVPAILVKALADDEEWKRIGYTAEKMLDIFVIVLSVASLAGGNLSAPLTIAAVLGAATATVDFALLSFIPDADPSKEYYMTNYRKIALFIEVPIAVPLLARDILIHGPKLLGYMAHRAGMLKHAAVITARNFIMKSITVAVLNIESANLVKGSLRVIEPLVEYYKVPAFIHNTTVTRLYENNALLVTGEAIAGNVPQSGIGLLYRGELVAFGTEKEISSIFKSLKGLRGASLTAQLEKLYYGIGKIPYGNSYLSRKSLELRKILPNPAHDGNIAVFAFERGGKIETRAFTTVETRAEWEALGFRERPHAEQIGKKWLNGNGIKKVIAVYSELEPCLLGGYECRNMLMREFPDALISFSYKYGDKISRTKAIQDRAKDMNRIINN